MGRRNYRTKAAETVRKTDRQIEFTVPDPSSSRAHLGLDLKRRKRVAFVDVDHRNSSNEILETQAGGRYESLDAKTSEFAFFKKLKSNFGQCYDSNKSSDEVKPKPKTFESRVKPGGTDRIANDTCKNNSLSTPIHSARPGSCLSAMSPLNMTQRNIIEEDSGNSSSSFSRDKDTIPSGNNLRSKGISDGKGDIFCVKRKKLQQWVKDTWFAEIPELNPNGHDLLSVLLTRLLPCKEETHPSRFTERTDRVQGSNIVDFLGSDFHKRSHESYTEVGHSLQMDRTKSISWQGWLEDSIAPSLRFAIDHVCSSFIPRDPEEINFPILYPNESVYRPPLLKQKPSLSFPVEEIQDSSPISSLHFRNYKPLSLDYHREESRYSSGDLLHAQRKPSSPLLLEWNTETASTREIDDLPLSYHTNLITYPNALSSSLTDDPWRSDYSSSHDLVTGELHPLPLISYYTSGSFLLPTTYQTSHFEHELERHIIDDDVMLTASQNLQTFRHTNSSDCLPRDHTDYHNVYHSPVDHCPFKVPECEIVSFPFSRIRNSYSLEASSPSPTQSDLLSLHI